VACALGEQVGLVEVLGHGPVAAVEARDDDDGELQALGRVQRQHAHDVGLEVEVAPREEASRDALRLKLGGQRFACGSDGYEHGGGARLQVKVTRHLPDEACDPLGLLVGGDVTHQHRERPFVDTVRGHQLLVLAGHEHREGRAVDLARRAVVAREQRRAPSELEARVRRAPV
jgi:hypothetical protein